LPAVATVALLIVAGCGQTPPPVPTTPTTSGDATIVDVATPPAASPVLPPGASPVAGGEATTLGDLVAAMDAAWPGVQSYRVSSVSGPIELVGSSLVSPAASPVASPVTAVLAEEILEVIEPDRRRRVTRRGETIEAEAIAIAGRIYVRGRLAELVRPGSDPAIWVEVDPATLDSASQAGYELGVLAQPLPPPTAAIPPNLWPQETRPLGESVIAGRICRAYAGAATTNTGGRQDLIVAIDEAGLPCLFESRGGGIVGRTIYEAFNLPLVIEPPTGAIAVGSPVPGTPAGRD
jgi:hypothetical protein